ncbi:FkbM family methyltransferase [bacterium AH-315-M05]|nr:FkbM family methyltransferase [bacterium AH-315-M05]
MSRVTSIIYQCLVKAYQILPFKKQICNLLKVLRIPHDKFYKDIKFRGKFGVNIDGKKFYLIHHYHSTIENEIYWKGFGKTWEKETLNLWMELCKQSTVIFDIGANTGIYGLSARTINGNAQIVCFEPSKSTFLKLKRNIQMNNFDIVAENVALSNKTGEQLFHDVKSEHQVSASLNPEKLKNFKGFSGELNEYMVKTQTLRNYIIEKGIKKIDLMKIDVEMHEPEVIHGFGKYLNEFKPTIIIEILTDDIAAKLNKLFDDSNYLFFHLSNDEKPKYVSNLDAGKQDNWNYLICEPEIANDLGLSY